MSLYGDAVGKSSKGESAMTAPAAEMCVLAALM
jgi:hypothetical protein